MTQEIREIISWVYRLYGSKNGDYGCEQIFADVLAAERRLRDYSGGIAQTDNELKEKLNFQFCLNSTISLLVSGSDMPNMLCSSIGGMKKQHNATLESSGTNQGITFSLTRSPSTTCSLLFSSLLLSKIWNFFSPGFSRSSKLFWFAANSLSSKLL